MKGKSMNQRSRISNHRREQGQISIFFAFGLLAATCLLVLILNTAAQTIRKGEMQNAADAGARAGAVTIGRSLNLISSNNRGMGEMISTMIVLRSVVQTAEAMVIKLPFMISLAKLSFNAPLAAALQIDLQNYQMLLPELRTIEAGVERTGWQTMNELDRLNQSIKTRTPALALSQAIEFSRSNGADRAPHGLLLAGLPNGPLPMLPVGRGRPSLIVTESDCELSNLKSYGLRMIMITAPTSSIVAAGVFESMVGCNSRSLVSGVAVCTGLSNTPPLTWPSSAPRPMILTDRPVDAAGAVTDVTEDRIDLSIVHQYLQLLNVSVGNLSPTGVLGGRMFANTANQWIVYGEADVYNPLRWSLFSQDWRAQLVRATLFNERLDRIGRALQIPLTSAIRRDLPFVNVH